MNRLQKGATAMWGHMIVVVTAIAVGLCVDALHAQPPGQESGTLHYQLPRVAVVDFINTHHDTRLAEGHERLADNLEAALFHTGRFQIVERRRLSDFLEERQLAREGLVDDPPGTASNLQGAPVDYLVMGTLEGDAHATTAIAKFVRVADPGAGSIAQSFSASGVTVPYVGYLAYVIAEKAKKAFMRGTILAIQDGNVLVDLGTEDGLELGDKLRIRGSDAAPEQKDVALAQVTHVEEFSGRARIIKRILPDIAIAKGMEVWLAPLDTASSVQTAQRRIVVATPRVLKPLDPEVDGGWFATALSNSLVRLQSVMDAQVLEREHLDEVYKEFALTESPLFDWSTTVKAGGLLGETTIVLATLARTDDAYRVAVRVNDQQDGRVLLATTQSNSDIFALPDSVAESISKLLQPLEFGEGTNNAINVDGQLNYDVIPTGQYACLSRMADRLVTVRIANTTDEQASIRVIAELSSVGADPAEYAVAVVEPGKTSQVRLMPRLDQARVEQLTQPTQDQILVRVYDEAAPDRLIWDRSYPVRLLPADVWLARQRLACSPDAPIVTDHAIVAWIDQPEDLMALRGEARRLCRLKALPGYQERLPGQPNLGAELQPNSGIMIVRDQVEAIYNAVQARQIGYVDQSAISFPNDSGQRVLRPAQVLAHGGANCLDGSVLFASALAPILQPLLIITSNHAFIGWRTWKDNDAPWDVLETTQVPYADFDTAVRNGRQEAERVGILDLLNGKGPDGPLTFQLDGLADPPMPNGVALIDVRTAQRFFQMPVP